MSLEPRLVLAVPARNAERYLATTLASLNGEGDLLRWWLQDGASTDQTMDIARQMARPQDHIASAPDHGQADALNRAMSAMGGDIIGFLNADDVLAPGTAGRILTYFRENPEVDLVYGVVEWIDAAGVVTGRHRGNISSLAEVLDLYGVWWAGCQWVQPEVFFRRALWEKSGPFNNSYELAFDYEFWVRCFLNGARVARLPEVLAQFRLHAEQKSRAAEKAADEIRRAVRQHLPKARLALKDRLMLEAQLGYDDYQRGTGASARGSFLAELLAHPQWLLAPPARQRAGAACRRLLARKAGAAT